MPKIKIKENSYGESVRHVTRESESAQLFCTQVGIYCE